MLKKNKETIFITGATGLVGSYILKVLLKNGHKVFCLARNKNNNAAKTRVENIVNFWDKKILSKYHQNLIILEGDILKVNLGLDSETMDLLRNEVRVVFHCAASTNLKWPIKELRKVNVEGTRNLLSITDIWRKSGKLRKVNYISTVYVCGNHRGIFKENDLDVGQRFLIPYERSKFEAEKLVEEYRRAGLWIDVFRPTLVVGESKTGKTITFSQSVYQVFRLWSKEIYNYLPIKNCYINIIFIDDLCKGIYIISKHSNLINRNYHIFKSETVSLENMLNIASKFMKFRKPKVISSAEFKKYKLTAIQKTLLASNILIYNYEVRLSSYLTNKFLEKYHFKFNSFDQKRILKLLKYCVDEGFLERN